MVIQDVMKTEVLAHSLRQVILQSVTKQTAHFNARPPNRFWILTAYLTSPLAGDVKLSGNLVIISPHQPKFQYLIFISVGLAIIFSSGKDPLMHAWAFLCIFQWKRKKAFNGLEWLWYISPSQHIYYKGHIVQHSTKNVIDWLSVSHSTNRWQ